MPAKLPKPKKLTLAQRNKKMKAKIRSQRKAKAISPLKSIRKGPIKGKKKGKKKYKLVASYDGKKELLRKRKGKKSKKKNG